MKLKVVAPTQASSIIANAVYLVSQGNNDLGISFFMTRSAFMRGYVTSGLYTTRLTSWNKKFMKVRQNSNILFMQ